MCKGGVHSHVCVVLLRAKSGFTVERKTSSPLTEDLRTSQRIRIENCFGLLSLDNHKHESFRQAVAVDSKPLGRWSPKRPTLSKRRSPRIINKTCLCASVLNELLTKSQAVTRT